MLEIKAQKEKVSKKSKNIRSLSYDESIGIPNIIEVKDAIDKWKENYVSSLDIIDDFFIKKMEELRSDLNKLRSKIETKKMNRLLNFTNNGIDGKFTDLNELIFKTKQYKITDEIGYANSFMRALTDLYIQASWLEGFSNINEIACKMLCKKIKKYLDLRSVCEESLHILYEQTFVNSKHIVIQFKNELKLSLAELFFKNNIKHAEDYIDEQLLGSPHILETFIFNICIGIIIGTIAGYILTHFIQYGK